MKNYNLLKKLAFLMIVIIHTLHNHSYSQSIPIPNVLKSAYSWSENYTESYPEFINEWHNIISNKPPNVDCIFNRVRIYEDLSDNCPTTNFLPSNDSKMIWEAPSQDSDTVPMNTFRSTSVNAAPDSLDYDFRYLMFTLGELADTSKRIFCIINGTHGAHEAHNIQISKYFVRLLFDNISEQWVTNFLNKFILMIIPCYNVYGNFPNDTYCSSRYGNGNTILYYDENDQVQVGNANLLANMGDLDDPEFLSLWEKSKIVIYNYEAFHSRTHPSTIKPKRSLGINHPDVVTYLSRLYPNTEPETRALRNLFIKLNNLGYKFTGIYDVHNNGYFRIFTDGWEFGLNPMKDEWILSSDSLYTSIMKEVWGTDNYPPAENPYNEKKLYRLLATEINPSSNIPVEIEFQDGGFLLPKNCLPFAEGATYPNNYVTINGEVFNINNAAINSEDSTLNLVGRVGVHSQTHPVGSKLLSSILDFPVIKGYTGVVFPEYLSKRFNSFIYRLVEIPANLTWLAGDYNNQFTTPLMYSFYLNIMFSAMYKIDETFSIPPTILSNPDTIAYTNQLYRYLVNATGYPKPKYYLDVSPSGMTIDSINGLITWIPQDTGSYNIIVRADNGNVPTSLQNFNITVQLAIAPHITSIPDTLALLDELFINSVLAVGYPSPTYFLINNPEGMTIDSINGILTWLPNSLGNYQVSIVAMNKWGVDTLDYNISVIGIAPIITSLPDTISRTGKLFTYDVNAVGKPVPKYYLDQYPNGMMIDSLSGVLQWTPSNYGTYSVTIRAENGFGLPALQSFNLHVLDITKCHPNLISYWKLDETFGNVYLDYFNGHNALSGTKPPIPVSGIVLGGQQFDEINNEIFVAANPDFDFGASDNFSIELWFKRTLLNQIQEASVLIGRSDYTSSMRWWIGINPDGLLQFHLTSKTGELNNLKGISSVNDTVWHHVAAIKDGSTNELRLYIDGQFEAAISASFTSGFDSPNAEITLGKLGYGFEHSFTGIIDEVAIYKDILDSFYVRNHYHGGLENKGYCDFYTLLFANLLLEGYYDSSSGLINTSLNSIVPLLSPYSQDPRSIDSIPSNVVDWVLLELRPAESDSAIFLKSALLSKNGFLVSDNGIHKVILMDKKFENCYIVIKHRNSIETWSSGTHSSFPEGLYYDFSIDSSQAFGNNLKNIGRRWFIYSGDVNNDGFVDSLDIDIIGGNAFNYSFGYLSADITGDGFVDLNDLVTCENNVFNSVRKISPTTK